MAHKPTWIVGSLVATLAGCYQGVGAAGDGEGSGGSETSAGSEDGGSDESGSDEASIDGDTVLRRLTAAQYRHAVRDVLGVELGDAPGQVESIVGFDNASETFTISDSLVEQYLLLAEELAQAIDPRTLSECDETQAGEVACVEQLLARVGRRLFRRPLEADEVAEYTELFTEIRAADDYATAVRTVLARMLISPHFLYHVELGRGPSEDGTSPLLTEYELAARLSFLLWDTTPDDTLLDAAAAGELDDDDGLATHVDRMLDDPRAREASWRFYRQWLELAALDTLYKADAVYPGANEIRDDLAEETRRFVDDVVFTQAGDLELLLTAPHTFANDTIAALYGLEPVGAEFTRVELDPAERSGVLTQPSLLAALAKPDKSAPVLRGKFVREHLLCAPLPPPPPGAGNIPPDTGEATTTRELFEGLTAAAECQGCHSQLNPMGFLFERYDAVGRWRDEENGVAVDASGEIAVGDVAGSFDGAIELAARLGTSDTVAACFVTQWFRWGYGRHELGGDDAMIAELVAAFDDGERRLADLPRLIASSPGFRRLHFRLSVESVEEGE